MLVVQERSSVTCTPKELGAAHPLHCSTADGQRSMLGCAFSRRLQSLLSSRCSESSLLHSEVCGTKINKQHSNIGAFCVQVRSEGCVEMASWVEHFDRYANWKGFQGGGRRVLMCCITSRITRLHQDEVLQKH